MSKNSLFHVGVKVKLTIEGISNDQTDCKKKYREEAVCHLQKDENDQRQHRNKIYIQKKVRAETGGQMHIVQTLRTEKRRQRGLRIPGNRKPRSNRASRNDRPGALSK
ncbi:hypothetical protein J2T14_002015 [Paenibacillus harenae]|nr:hypothetical protein [Paenibacillus harenae]